ncbi:glucans biosynthesis glucosyltransferase MdoH [Teichococcus oryzae]|uniref:glucans biosynthesis glucosyltransferase MdoH n=1 Tax=Teichococcus oryzae TaxID=1608942 RepID=UPI001F4F319D|nr:glucans biosynthesis glucosyltransferase MdoH [Pseudoroseomonas oryzae]
MRRPVFIGVCLVIALGLLLLMGRVLAPGGWTGWEVLLLLAWLGTLPWTALCAGNALIGFGLRLAGRSPASLDGALAGPPDRSTAIILCLRHEDSAAALRNLVPLLDGLEAAGAGHRFTLWLLSDSQEAAAVAREEAAVAAFATLRSQRLIPVRYRRRTVNHGFKAGNVMDFLDHHAAGHDYALCLDADSEMTAAAVLRLVAMMEADPRLAILQPLIAGRPAATAFTRIFQFGMRAGMRVWASGQDWWQGDEGPYWGHNALLRIAPFRDHARLEPLPDGSHILSHDQIEAVRLHAAGWKVRCLPDDAGSLEGNPPTLPDFLIRDQRWGAGNMQYWALLRLPGLRPVGRWQLLQAILLFASSPLWLVLLLAAVGNVATGGGAATEAAALGALLLANWLALYAPKLLGYAELLFWPWRAAAYGGRRAVARGALAELVFTAFCDPLVMADKALFLLRLPFGARPGWLPQNRDSQGVRWRDAARLLWPQAVLGGLSLAGLLAGGGTAWLWGLPVVLPLLLGIPFAVLTAHPGFSGRLRRAGLCRTPEEVG